MRTPLIFQGYSSCTLISSQPPPGLEFRKVILTLNFLLYNENSSKLYLNSSAAVVLHIFLYLCFFNICYNYYCSKIHSYNQKTHQSENIKAWDTAVSQTHFTKFNKCLVKLVALKQHQTHLFTAIMSSSESIVFWLFLIWLIWQFTITVWHALNVFECVFCRSL